MSSHSKMCFISFEVPADLKHSWWSCWCCSLRGGLGSLDPTQVRNFQPGNLKLTLKNPFANLFFREVFKHNTGSLETRFCKCSFSNRPLLHTRKHLYGFAVNKTPQTQPSRTLSRNYFKMSTEPPNQSQLELVSGLRRLPFQSKSGRWGHQDLGTLTVLI